MRLHVPSLIFILVALEFFLLGAGSTLFSQMNRILICVILLTQTLQEKQSINESIKIVLWHTTLFLMSLLVINEVNYLIEVSTFCFLSSIFLMSRRKNIDLNGIIFSKKLLGFILLVIYVQLLYSKLTIDQYTLFRGDRNHSGIILLFFSFILFYHKNYKLLLCLIPAFILLLSRNPIFSILFFVAIYVLKIKKRKTIGTLSLVFFMIMPMVVNYIFTNVFGDVQVSGSQGVERLIQLKDGSNVLRFKVAGEQLNHIYNNLSQFLLRSQSINDLTRHIVASEMPHNSYVELFYRLGVIRMTLFFYLIYSAVKQSYKTFVFSIVLLFSGSILHNVFTTNLIYLLPLLALNSKNEKSI